MAQSTLYRGRCSGEGHPDILYRWRAEASGLTIRNYKAEDAGELKILFSNTVRHVNNRDYTLAQLEAWAPDTIDAKLWQSAMDRLKPFIAEMDSNIVGYGDLQSDGLIDHLFVHKDYQGKGIASKLIKRIIAESREKKISRLYSHVSITAKPFFEHWGFVVKKQKQVEINQQMLTNFLMELNLQPCVKAVNQATNNPE